MCNDLHVTGIWLKKLSYLEKMLLICTVFVLIDVKTERSHDRPLRKKYVFRSLQNRRVWDGVKHRNKEEHSSS